MSDPGFIFGQVPTAAMWNNAFGTKQDNLGFTPLNKAGDAMGGKLVTTASIAAAAGFAILPGVAPSSPINGDVWLTSVGMFAQVNGSTTQLATGGAVNSGTANQLAYYATSGAAISGDPNVTVFNGALTLGQPASIAGTVILSGLVSGGVTLASAHAGGSGTITFPAGTIDFSVSGGASQVIKQTSAGGIFTVGQLAASDLSNGTTGSGAVVLAGAPSFTSTVNASTGYQVNGSAVSGNVLRGNGTNFVSAKLAVSDLSNTTTGTGAIVLASAPTLIAPNIGIASGTSLALANGTGLILNALTGSNGQLAMGAGGTLLFTLGSTADAFAVVDHLGNPVFQMSEGILGTMTTTQTTVQGAIIVGNPGGGFKGSGTINVATNIYLNNTAYTNPDYVFERYYTGSIRRFAEKPGAKEYTGLMPLSRLREYTQEHLRLPGIDDNPAGVVERFDTVLLKLEEMTLYILDLNEKFDNLKT